MTGVVERPDRAATRSPMFLAPGLILVLAAAVRFFLLARSWPASNSDEATFGLMAMHIAEGRDFPDFMYGQSYMGSAESYLAAAAIRVLGPSLFALRLPLILLYLVFLAITYVLGRRLYGTGVALVSVGLLALGSRELYGYESIAEGAVPETLVIGSALLLLGHQLLATAGRGRSAGRRWLLFGWGAAVTFGLWSTMLVAPFVLCSGVLVWLSRRPSPGSPARRGGVRFLAGGLTLGALPWLAHDVTHPFGESSLATLADLYVHGGTGLNGGQSAGLPSQVTNTVTTSLAYITGGSATAHPFSPPAWPVGFYGSWRPPTGNLVATAWGVGVVALWAAALVGALRARHPHRCAGAPSATRQPRLYGQLAMLAGAGLTTAAFMASPTPGVAPANNVRYLVGVLIATPALVAPLLAVRPRALRWGSLGLVWLTLLIGTAQALRDTADGRVDASDRQLIQALRANGVGHFYTSYTDCNRLIYVSHEQLICAVLFEGPGDTGLLPGLDRYPPYRATVRADPAAAYVFHAGDPRTRILAGAGCRWRSHWTVGDYEVWQPAQPCGIAS